MSKLTKALVPGYGANPTKPNSNPLSGLAPNLENGLPQGLPTGIGKAALKYSNPVGGFSPDVNGDFGYQKGWLDRSSNGTPDKPAAGPGYNVWADPDITKRGWGWGMGADGALHTGVVGGGPAGSIWGPQGTNNDANASPSSGATNTGAQPTGFDPHAMAGQFSQGFNGSQGGPLMKLVQGMRSMSTPGGYTPPGMGATPPGLNGQMPAPAAPATTPQQFGPQQYLALAQQMRAGQNPQQGPTTV